MGADTYPLIELCSVLHTGMFGVNGILTDTLLLVEEKIGVEVGFEVSRLHQTPANRKSISLHQTGLRACQARRSRQAGFYITSDGRAAHTSCPFTEDLITELLFMTPDAWVNYCRII